MGNAGGEGRRKRGRREWSGECWGRVLKVQGEEERGSLGYYWVLLSYRVRKSTVGEGWGR